MTDPGDSRQAIFQAGAASFTGFIDLLTCFLPVFWKRPERKTRCPGVEMSGLLKYLPAYVVSCRAGVETALVILVQAHRNRVIGKNAKDLLSPGPSEASKECNSGFCV